ncbi:ankyrin repeat domain-containing protein [Ruegeria marina]|uniref:Cytochrome c n=1 Tax=Ruegeria marina TaxID=639004 RepID=A0A1G7FDM0_9RHOB|nr:ankyrin repeat domain-containing protein [Ruegeria marina]SDE73960.1 cytochrome c [Ruegeria marina]
MNKIYHTLCAAVALFGSATAGATEMIHLMARKGDVEKVLAEIEKGTDVDLPSTMHTNLAGSSPLFVAASFGRTEVVKALLAAGANPNFRRPEFMGENTYGAPLHTAISFGHSEVVKLLLEAGADPALPDPSLGTPLHVARIKGHAAIEEMLLEQGVPQTIQSPSVAHLLPSADVERGKLIGGGCAQCHQLSAGSGDDEKEGPPLWDLLGRQVASVASYNYSSYLSAIDGDWTYDNLNSFLSDPYQFVPGTKMANRGLADEQDRADLIAYLRTLSDNPQPLP